MGQIENKESLLTSVALGLIASVGLVLVATTTPGIIVAYQKLSHQRRKYRNKDIGRFAKKFYKEKLTSIAEKGGETTLILNENGHRRVLKENFDKITLKPKRDGKFRLLIFDIPEVHKLARNLLRKRIREMGFEQLQKSAFITPYICESEVEFITNYLGISRFVILLKVDKAEFEPYLNFKSEY